MPVTAPIAYLPLGDSITEITCWRSLLWSLLRNPPNLTDPFLPRTHNILVQPPPLPNIRFVGTMTTQAPGGCPNSDIYPRHHEGHSGIKAVDAADKNRLREWLAKAGKVDIVTIHLGTNDILYGLHDRVERDMESAVIAYDEILSELRRANPRVKVI
ncbi:MAG: hypothetical protein LQ340_006372, partial [Diploschistes diacapsis]